MFSTTEVRRDLEAEEKARRDDIRTDALRLAMELHKNAECISGPADRTAAVMHAAQHFAEFLLDEAGQE